MPASMTGFGTGAAEAAGVQVAVELRAVNHRHLDARFRPSLGLPALEARLLGVLRERLARGHVDARVTAVAHDAASALQIDVVKARAYAAAGAEIADALGTEERLALRDVIALPGVVEAAPSHELLAARPELAVNALNAAIDGLIATRNAEGAALAADLEERLQKLTTVREEIHELAAGQVADRREQLRSRIAAALQHVGAALDEGRLEQEVAHLADRSDITEELVRLKAHLETFSAALRSDQPIGRKLGFLGQELLREINTIGSKAQLLRITELVVEAKVEIEKIREQVLNFE